MRHCQPDPPQNLRLQPADLDYPFGGVACHPNPPHSFRGKMRRGTRRAWRWPQQDSTTGLGCLHAPGYGGMVGLPYLDATSRGLTGQGFGRLAPWLAAPRDAWSQLLLSRPRVVADLRLSFPRRRTVPAGPHAGAWFTAGQEAMQSPCDDACASPCRSPSTCAGVCRRLRSFAGRSWGPCSGMRAHRAARTAQSSWSTRGSKLLGRRGGLHAPWGGPLCCDATLVPSLSREGLPQGHAADEDGAGGCGAGAALYVAPMMAGRAIQARPAADR